MHSIEITDPKNRNALLVEIRAALLAYYGDPIQPRPGADWTEVRDTQVAREEQSDQLRSLINRAVVGGITHRQIAAATQWSGRVILGWIDDAKTRAEAGALEQHHLEREIKLLRADRQRDAYARRVGGEDKNDIAASFDISRPTLDSWLSEVVDN